MKAQEIFNKVKTHLLAQNEKAREKYGSCRYKDASGNKCAIGCLIKSEDYDERFEDNGPHVLIERFGLTYLLPEDMPPYKGVNFLEDLQKVHDQFEVGYWPRQLEMVRDAYRLNEEVAI